MNWQANRIVGRWVIWIAIGLIILGSMRCSPSIPSQRVEQIKPPPEPVEQVEEVEESPFILKVVTSAIILLILGLSYTTNEN